MKILVTGKDGQVGWELQRVLAPLGDIAAFDRSQLDLSRECSIRERVREVSPHIIVNTGAYTAVDKAVAEPDLAMTINGVAPGILAQEAHRLNALLIHYSTDYVFDGTKSGPYTEEDVPNPLNVYGATKLAGERAIQAAGAGHMILRTSWVYGARGHNFMLTMLRLAREREELQVISDQIGAPTWCRSLAEATERMLRGRLAKKSAGAECDGIFHVTASGSTSWFEFAREILTRTEADRTRQPKLTPILSEHYKSAAKRPKNSLLSNQKLERTFSFGLKDWKEELKSALRDLP